MGLSDELGARQQYSYDGQSSSTSNHNTSYHSASPLEGYRLSSDSQNNDERPASPEYQTRLSDGSIDDGEEPHTPHQAQQDDSLEEPFTEVNQYVEDVVQPGFEEAILRALCEMDVSERFCSILALLLERLPLRERFLYCSTE